MYKLIFALFLVTIIVPCSADDGDLSELLSKADEHRSSNPNEFNRLVKLIQNNQKLLSSNQNDYFNYLLAYKASFTGDFKKALILHKGILKSKSSNLLKFRANLSIVNIYAIAKNWTEGLAHLSKSFEQINGIESSEHRQHAHLVAALFYNQLGQYELGLRYANKLDDLVSEGRNACLAKQLAIESKLKLGLLDETSSDIQEGINLCEKSNEKLMTAIIYTHVANLLLEQSKYKEVVELFNSKISTVEIINYAPLSAKFYSLLSEALLGEKNILESESYAIKTVNKSQKIGGNEPTVKAYKILYQIAESRGDHKLALEYHKKFAEADRAYLDDIKTKHLAFQLAEHQTTEHKSRIELLDKQNNLLTIEQKLSAIKAENNRLFIAMLIAIITLLVFWAYKSWMTQKRLKQLAEYDALTGILNRGHFTQVAQSALKYCANTDMYLSCILFDLDKFKNINDSYGHACGDWVLKRVAEVCQAQGRKNDIFARLGGEEFCVVLPSCDLLTATKLAEEYRKVIERIDSADSGFDFTISASFGVTDTLRSGHALEKLIADADEAMYESKHNGRNRITVYSVPDKDADSDENTAANSDGAQADLPLFTGS
ncbi:GGDEF domain-containing protein [Shewanella sp. YLB-07]|uniref:tetratricopeptide repeat-containing diguanylate cyclase n=1 Tax=Shewanella sp. YLB-07 TaxID=2601268 RepID=UPI00128BBA4C|nr:GGDEF domain-containing protein [Shewanella sp. YLB-07]MPY23395.1 GGDEF domain-containing protein [Shewanella sp. YLB-07]